MSDDSSAYVFPRSGWAAPCPVCAQPSDTPCRTLKTRRVTDTHSARFSASYDLRRLAAAAEAEATS